MTGCLPLKPEEFTGNQLSHTHSAKHNTMWALIGSDFQASNMFGYDHQMCFYHNMFEQSKIFMFQASNILYHQTYWGCFQYVLQHFSAFGANFWHHHESWSRPEPSPETLSSEANLPNKRTYKPPAQTYIHVKHIHLTFYE